MPKSNTQRTLEYLRNEGYMVDIVERYLSCGGRKFGVHKDLFGIIDLIAIGKGSIIGVQSTGQDFAGHLRTITIEKRAESIEWLKSGGELMLIGWRKVKKKLDSGKWSKSKAWSPRIRIFELSQFKGVSCLDGMCQMDDCPACSTAGGGNNEGR